MDTLLLQPDKEKVEIVRIDIKSVSYLLSRLRVARRGHSVQDGSETPMLTFVLCVPFVLEDKIRQPLTPQHPCTLCTFVCVLFIVKSGVSPSDH